jgi:hypothetical protein
MVSIDQKKKNQLNSTQKEDESAWQLTNAAKSWAHCRDLIIGML